MGAVGLTLRIFMSVFFLTANLFTVKFVASSYARNLRSLRKCFDGEKPRKFCRHSGGSEEAVVAGVLE